MGLPLMSKRGTQSSEFKAKVAMEAIINRNTIQEIAADHAIPPIQVSQSSSISVTADSPSS